MISLEVLQRDEYNVALRFHGAKHHVLNAIRRAVIEDVPTMAIDVVYFMENNSVLHDEALAHRLAMVPFTSGEALERYRPPEECAEKPEEEGCSVRAYLDVSNEEDGELVVYSGDIKTDDPSVRPVYPNIPIVVLAKGQKVVLEALVRLGRGKEHIKWSPVSVSTLTRQPTISFDLTRLGDEVAKECVSCISYYDATVARLVSERRRGELELNPLRPTGLIRYCAEKVCGGAIRVLYVEDKCILRFESTGSLAPERILAAAINEVRRKVSDFHRQVRGFLENRPGR